MNEVRIQKNWHVLGHRNPQIDVLYTIGIILVLLGHSHSSNWNTFSGTILDKLIGFIYVFHMPLFFFIAGYLFVDSNSFASLGYWRWMKEKTLKLLTPYTVLSMIALFPKYYIENGSLNGILSGGWNLVRVLLQPRLGVWGHFWFLPVLWMTYLCFGLWKVYVLDIGNDGNGRDRKRVKLAFSILIGVVLYFLSFSTEWLGFADFKQTAIFFSLGMVIKGNQWERNISDIMRVLSTVGALVITIFLRRWLPGNYGMELIAALLLINVCWNISAIVGEHQAATWISKHNFTIYIYSWPFQAVVMAICDRAGFAWYLTTPCMFIIGFVGPALLALAYEKIQGIHCRFFYLVTGAKALEDK